jgi:hypothetical protein
LLELVHMRRRILISMLCLCLASLAPAPLSACAMWMALPADCAPAATPVVSHCEEMAAVKAGEENSASLRANPLGLPCCQLAAAPVPDASANAGKSKVAPADATLVRAPQVSFAKVFERAASQAEYAQFDSPPDQQSLLCTFLI